MVKVFLDSGKFSDMQTWEAHVSGFTTNPSLMKSGGAKNYREYAQQVMELADGKPVSFEVFSDDFQGIYDQACQISEWGDNVYVKVPCINTMGLSTLGPIRTLSKEGVKINVTAIFTLEQIRTAARAIYQPTPAILSVFAGRIADTGRDPVPFITAALQVKHDNTQILWASTREAYNIKQAEQIGCDIITCGVDILKKHQMFGKSLEDYSLETVKQFVEDAKRITL